jgi:hypothetical protein
VTGTGGATAGITLATSSNSVTAPVGGTTTNLITATSTGSFAGTVSYRAAITSSNGANFSGCYTVPNGTLAAGGSVASTIMIQTTSTGCTSTSIRLGSAPLTVARTISSQESWPGPGGLAVFSAGLMGFFFLRRRIRPASLLLIAASALAFGLAGCGSGGTSTTNTTATSAGTYTIQITGTGTPTTGSTVTAATSFNIIVQ